MKIKLLLTLCLAALLTLPSLAQKRLGVPHVTEVYAVDYSTLVSELGWCLNLAWEDVPGAASYAIKVWGGKKGWTPYSAAGARQRAKWRPITEYGYSPENRATVAVCWLADKQRVKVRLRAVDSAGKNGQQTQTVSVKLPKYAEAPISPRTGLPTEAYFGFSFG